MPQESLSIGWFVVAFQFTKIDDLLVSSKKLYYAPAQETKRVALFPLTSGEGKRSKKNVPLLPIQGLHSTLFLLPLPRVFCQCPFCEAGEKTPVQHVRTFLPEHRLLPLPGD